MLIKESTNIKFGKPDEAHPDWEQSYWRNIALKDLWLEQLRRGNQVVSGGSLTLNGNDIDLDATEVQFGGSLNSFSLAAATPIVGLSTGNTYIIYVDNTGTLITTAITNANLWDQALPADLVLLGVVFEMERTVPGTKEWVISNAPNLASKPAPLPPGHLSGLGLSNNAGDGDHDIDIAAGACRDGADGFNLRLTAALTKQIDAPWAAGSGAGGFAPAGGVQADTWYHLHLIRKEAGGAIDAMFDTSVAAANIPAGYTAYRRLGAVRTDEYSNILAFSQLGEEFLWKDPPLDVDVNDLGMVATAYALSVPPGLQLHAIINVWMKETSSTVVYVYSPDANDEAASQSAAPLGSLAYSRDMATLRIRTDTARQIKAVSSHGNTEFNIATLGWIDRRGRE